MEKAKVIEVLNEEYDRAVWLREIQGNAYLNDVLIALLTAIDALEQNNGWISVKDRMPEPNTEVLAYCDNGRMLTVGYFDKRLEYLTSGKVTHWRPLPEPPKESDEE